MYRMSAPLKELRKEKGLSWTLSKDTAEWFMNRYEGKNNHVLTAKVKKKIVWHILIVVAKMK